MATDIKINLDSKHLPYTAAAWQSWKIIGVTFVCGFVGVFGILVLSVLAWHATADSRKTPQDRLRDQFFDRCMAQFTIENDGMRGDTGFAVCKSQSKLQYP
jgi:hypothetical protein